MAHKTDYESVLDSLIHHIPNAIFWKDADLVFRGCNRQFSSQFGYNDPEQIAGKSDRDFPFTPELIKKYHQDDREIITSGIAKINFEETQRQPNGSVKTVLVSKVPLFHHNKIIGILGIYSDITQRKQMEERLRAALNAAEEANRAKTVFLANISHDVKTPLAGIIGTAEFLAQQTENIAYKGRAESIVQSGIRLLELMSELIELSRMESGEIQNKQIRFSLRSLIDDIEQLVKPAIEDKSLNLKIKYDKKIPKYLIGHRSNLYRTILNLVANATKFTSHGSITIKVDLVAAAKKTVTIRVAVKDTGIGIPKDKQSIIFDRFTRLTPSYEGVYKGSGLGLYIVKQFVEEMSGEIYLESEEGVGSTFICLIPLKKTLLQSADLIEESHLQKIKTTAKSKSCGVSDTSKICFGVRVLLVEDNAIAAQTTQDILRTLGCEVDIANSGKIALRLFKSGEYDLIFMDLGLPDINGASLTKKIRKIEEKSGQKTAIFALSAHIDENIKAECKSSDMDDVFAKPLLRNHAIEILSALTNKKTSAKPLKPTKKSSQQENLKVIDLELGASIIGTDIEGAKEALKLFVESVPAAQLEIEEGYKNRDIEKLIHVVHRMHGGLCYCGAPRLKELVKNFEANLRSGDTSQLDKFYTQMRLEIKKLMSVYAEKLY